jgi:hypothetical protein
MFNNDIFNIGHKPADLLIAYKYIKKQEQEQKRIKKNKNKHIKTHKKRKKHPKITQLKTK